MIKFRSSEEKIKEVKLKQCLLVYNSNDINNITDNEIQLTMNDQLFLENVNKRNTAELEKDLKQNKQENTGLSAELNKIREER